MGPLLLAKAEISIIQPAQGYANFKFSRDLSHCNFCGPHGTFSILNHSKNLFWYFDQCALILPSKIGGEFVGVLRVGFSTTKLIQVFLHYKSRVNDEVHSMMSSMTTVVKQSLAQPFENVEFWPKIWSRQQYFDLTCRYLVINVAGMS